MTVESIISGAVAKAISSLYGVSIDPASIVPQATRKEFEGNLTIVVFPYLKASHKSPEATATEIGEWLVTNEPAVEKFNVVKGFLNISINPAFWLGILHDIAADSNFGIKKADENSDLVMVEYSSPNTNKPLHLGHVRNNLLGYSLSCILEANGHKVVKTNIVNDRGIHICKSMLAWKKWGNGATPESAGKKGDHLIGDFYVEFDKHFKAEVKELMDNGRTKEEAEAESPLMLEAREMLRKWEAGDEEVRSLWKTMNEWVYEGFDETYRRLGVNFDKIYYESDTYLEGKDLVLGGIEKGIMYRKEDGSVWADLTGDGLDHKLLLRADGTSVYMTQDIGTAKLRYQDFPIDKMIYVVGNEQNYHFQVLSLLLDKLGFKWGKDLTHFSYGMVELPEGKMKSREGTVVDADDLIQQMVDSARETSADRFADMPEEEAAEVARMVGLGALKYFLLKVDPKKNMLFNPKESIDFNGNTGPFLQYTYARIQSVIRRAGGIDMSATPQTTPNEKESTLIQKVADFPSVVKEAGRTYSPALIANYCYDLAKEYNQFYHDYSILKEEDEAKRTFRLLLSAVVARTLKSGVSLLGMEMPERM
ncbi:arginine--tRNA ligase [Lepagella muris]|jgi:arginyl-tRNA synthetase|uniref:Arginine--tRNA ligase n=2 Tax=Muribaculaceae TaxID=2005473 RepID=A0AC61RG83_9BACT|nr:arginine--tRNA ligase [Lepagella muris]ROT04607.1 arginine--tRNA ligase [Muribaculaceae bacterium Isolate-037 (Harlan)]TGY79312.1 arginine--tRNA ligase [Lepagella muris]THG52579.1 arginine--tRNA ligase [Bacteroidales bacterium]TKC62937.1 arginine--tRNA ligase [Bacteroidales bacterium]